MLSDLRYAVRALKRSPGFSAIVIVTLGLGIGAAIVHRLDPRLPMYIEQVDPAQTLRS